MTPPVVSIVIPVYRAPIPLLERCIRSALNQSQCAVEVIAVDDASADACPVILEAAAARDARLRVVRRTTNGGAGAARSDGLAAATGEFVLFADADDCLAPDACARLLDAARHARADVVACGWRQCDAGGAPRRVTRFVPRRYDVTRESDRVRCLQTLNVPLWNKLIRRETIAGLRFGTFEATVGEDLLFLVSALCRSRTVATTAFCGYDYTEHALSSTGRSAKGLPYLRALLASLAAVRDVLSATTGGGRATRRYLDRLTLQRFATGCAWIAGVPDSSERTALWDFWRGAFTRTLQPALSSHMTPAAWCARAGLVAGPSAASRLTRLACAATAPRACRDRRSARV